MTTPFRGVPPRLLQRMLDNKAGRFPTVKRTGDGLRTGVQNDPFDDRRTLVYSTSSLVGWPQKLSSTSVHYDASLDPTGQFILQTGSIRKGVSDSLITQSTAVQVVGPYREVQAPEQGQFTDFWLTGTSVFTGPGFTSPLRSKTQIKLNLPVASPLQMLATTASMVYYDTDSSTWTIAGGTDATTNPGDLGKPIIENFSLATFDDMSILNLAGNDGRLFGPYGNCITSGSRYLNGVKFGDPNAIAVNNGVLSTLLTTIASGSTLLNENFAASDTEQIALPQVEHPFLLEKVHVKMPIKAGPGWFNDRTLAYYMAFCFGVSDALQTTASIVDAGGPCVTWALQRQDVAGRRELITSATIIPETDNISVTEPQAHLFENGIEFQVAPAVTEAHTAPAGFLSFAKPSVTVTPDSNNQFTGTVEFVSTVGTSNGVVASQEALGIASTTLTTSSYEPGTFSDSLILGVNPFGRAMDLRPSGRSILGKEYTAPDYGSNPTSPYEGIIDPSYDVFVIDNYTPSPYLILPGDKIIMSVSKYRPVRDQFATGTITTLHSASDLVRGVLSGSHDFVLDEGNIEVTMYGSLVREGHEFHFGCNQPLNSLAIHESLQSDAACLDQYDVESPAVYSGSYIDDVITGTLAVINGEIVQTRGVQISAVGQRALIPTGKKSTGSLFRNVQFKTRDERYFDTLLPPAGDLTKVDGGAAYNTQLGTKDAEFNYIQLGQVNGPGGTATNVKWDFAFPFEPRYAGIQRQRNPAKDTEAQTRVGIISPAVETGVSLVRQLFSTSKVAPEQTPPISGETYAVLSKINAAYPGQLVAAKGFYGFGKGVDQFNNRNRSAKYIGTDGFPKSDGANVYYRYTDAEIQGWKYGIKNGVEQNSSAVFRRDRYGQFRDMLEQRPFTKYQGAIFVRRGCVRVRFTLPDAADTDSSNLSIECTSSLPYFDGEIRNRPAEPNVDLVQIPLPDTTPFVNVNQQLVQLPLSP